MAKMIIEFDFDVDTNDPDFKNLILKEIKADFTDGMTSADGDNLAESWAQSDYYWVGITNSIISAIGGDVVTDDDIRNNY